MRLTVRPQGAAVWHVACITRPAMTPGLTDLLAAFVDSPEVEAAAEELSRPRRSWWTLWLRGVLV